MQVNIWSDVRCPFCYIGKKKFERALAQFPHRNEIQIIWHSFQLDPALKTQPQARSLDYLAKVKGITREHAAEMHKHVERIGHTVGIDFQFENVIVANSFNAHRLIQMAKTRGLADKAEEELFKAHFVEGLNIDDTDALTGLGSRIGLEGEAVRRMLASDEFSAEVEKDEVAARSIGIRGVPFFIFNDMAAVSGAQAPEFFLQTLATTYADYESSIKLS